MNKPLIQLSNASVSRHGLQILRDINLRVFHHEFVGIIGPNGAGKTTLLHLINGMQKPGTGNVEVLSMQTVNGHGNALRKRIGLVAQVEQVDPRLPINVRESVMTGICGVLGWFKRPSRADWQRIDEAIEMVGLASLARRPVGQLSGGEYQRVAIARALVQQPNLFLFDEPTASIDPRAQKEIIALVDTLHRQNETTSLFVTHSLDTLPRSCDRIIMMKNGTIWRDGLRKDLINNETLHNLYAYPPKETVCP